LTKKVYTKKIGGIIMKKIYLILMFILLMFPTILMAVETDSLWVGNITIKIGMDKNEVINALSENFDVVRDNIKHPTWEYWCIYKKTKIMEASGDVGRVAFQKDKVVWVSKSWGGFSGNEVLSFGQELAVVLSKLKERGKTTVNIQIYETKEPGVSLKTIHFVSGNHSVIINVGGNGINLQEDISK
jgi:hypothetical protein